MGPKRGCMSTYSRWRQHASNLWKVPYFHSIMRQALRSPILLTTAVALLVLTGLSPLVRQFISTPCKEQSLAAPFNGSLGFAKIFYISLPECVYLCFWLISRRTDRQDHMSLAFYLSGLKAGEVSRLSKLN